MGSRLIWDLILLGSRIGTLSAEPKIEQDLGSDPPATCMRVACTSDWGKSRTNCGAFLRDRFRLAFNPLLCPILRF